MTSSTKKLTIAAVCTALAVIMCVMTAYLPLTFMPLYMAAFCIFLACKRGGIFYGALCAAASAALMFLMTGLSVKWLIFLVMFVPYGIFAYLLHPLKYFKAKTAVVRGVAAVAFFNATFAVVYVIVTRAAGVGIDGLDMAELASKLGGYPVFALIATLALLPLDFIFTVMADVVLKRVPAPGAPRPLPPQNVPQPGPGASAEEESAKRVDDVFGYEIFEPGDDNNE